MSYTQEKKAVMGYAVKKGQFTIPELQVEFGYSFVNASEIVGLLVESKLVELAEDGTYFQLTKPTGKTAPSSKEEPLGKGRFEPRETEKDVPMFESIFDDTPKTRLMYWEIVRELRMCLSPKREGRKAYFDMGVCYPDDTQYSFVLEECEDYFILQDEGKTAEYLRKKMLPKVDEKFLEKQIDSVIKEYNITFEGGRLVTEIKTASDSLPSLLFFFSAIERLSKLDMEQ